VVEPSHSSHEGQPEPPAPTNLATGLVVTVTVAVG
jgi:hypothetical protein